jgi:hypothetical protein
VTDSVQPPGWLPDPSRRFEYRYWDGARWSDTHFGSFSWASTPTASIALTNRSWRGSSRGGGMTEPVESGLSEISVGLGAFLDQARFWIRWNA